MTRKPKLIDQIVLDRYWEPGIDWSSGFKVLVDAGPKLKLLWHLSGKSWEGQLRGYQRFPTSLVLWDDRRLANDCRMAPYLHEGGRLSATLITAYSHKIDEAFGAGTADAINVAKTLVLPDWRPKRRRNS